MKRPDLGFFAFACVALLLAACSGTASEGPVSTTASGAVTTGSTASGSSSSGAAPATSATVRALGVYTGAYTAEPSETDVIVMLRNDSTQQRQVDVSLEGDDAGGHVLDTADAFVALLQPGDTQPAVTSLKGKPAKVSYTIKTSDVISDFAGKSGTLTATDVAIRSDPDGGIGAITGRVTSTYTVPVPEAEFEAICFKDGKPWSWQDKNSDVDSSGAGFSIQSLPDYTTKQCTVFVRPSSLSG